MKRLEKILFVYSIVVLTTITIILGIFNPSSYTLLSSILLAPILLFFWLRVTSPQDVSLGKWSLRLLVVIFILSALGVYASFLWKFALDKDTTQIAKARSESAEKLEELEGKIKTYEEELRKNENLTEELANIKDQLERLNNEGKLTLGTSDSDLSFFDFLTGEDATESASLGQVTIKNAAVANLDVFAEPKLNSQKVGVMSKGQIYTYYETDGAWFKIKLIEEVYGWVNEKDITRL